MIKLFSENNLMVSLHILNLQIYRWVIKENPCYLEEVYLGKQKLTKSLQNKDEKEIKAKRIRTFKFEYLKFIKDLTNETCQS